MSQEYTLLRKGDYLFLERFLDSTKANLFFATGVILVEGDAENILLPIIAELMDMSISKNGISIVNVGSTAFLRYSNIFAREDDTALMGIPVSCITDVDVKPRISGCDYKLGEIAVSFEQALKYHKERKMNLYSKQDIKCFVSDDWTLEYCIALGEFQVEFFKAVLYSKCVQNSEKYGLTEKKKKEADTTVTLKIAEWDKNDIPNEQRAYYIYNDTLLNPSDKISKAIVSQYFSMILTDLDKQETRRRLLEDRNLKYLRDAIIYATGRS
jgi:putative ATP-dependent endonuclease of OLD family